MLLKVCANGARDISEHQTLSNNPVSVAAECANAIKTGAGSVHVHPKNHQGGKRVGAPGTLNDGWVLCVSTAQGPR